MAAQSHEPGQQAMALPRILVGNVDHYDKLIA
jgi:hypothetical protein